MKMGFLKLVFILCLLISYANTRSGGMAINDLSFGDIENPGRSPASGDKAKIYEFPYQVSLQLRDINNNYQHICGGAILSSTWVVTTAYCTSPFKNFRIVAGSLVHHRVDTDVQAVAVENVMVHPHYKGQISENDIALLKLEHPLTFTKTVQPIDVASPESARLWGASLLSSWNVQTQLSKQLMLDSLYYMVVHVMNESKCASALGRSKVSPATILCTEKSEDALFCPGESGAPLVYGGYLIGITSWGLVPCGITVYTKISFFLDFIAMFVGDLQVVEV